MGGIASAEDAIEMLIAGADAIGVGTAMFANPYLPLEIISGIEQFLSDNSISSVRELTNTVKPWG